MSHTFLSKLLAILIGFVLAFAQASPAQAADGSLDITFGNGGIVLTDFGSDQDYGADLAVQPDGKIVVVGSSFNGTDSDFALARYNPDGSLDLSFGVNGKMSTEVGNSFDYASAIAMYSDGRLILVGNTSNGADFDLGLVRYLPDGGLDLSFGGFGRVTTSVGSSNDYSRDVVLQPDGKILVAGFSYDSAIGGDTIVLARYHEHGALDDAFGNGGVVITNLGCGAAGFSLSLQPDGKILVAGDQCGIGRDFSVVRYNNDGSLDTTFDNDGIANTDFGNSHDTAEAIVVQPDGKIVLAGDSYTDPNISIDFALARYNSDGSLDMTFDGDGKVTTDLGGWRDFGNALALQPDGKILVTGEQWQQDGGSTDFALARYNSDGSLDLGFGIDGKVITDLGSGGDIAAALALQADGRILVTGYSNSDFALVRYESAGSLIEATIDVRPGKFPNRIEIEKDVCKDKTNLPVAILTTPGFDALRLVDATSLQLGDPALGGTAAPIDSRGRDIDRDGDKDVWLLFALCDLVLNNALNENSHELILTGGTLEGGTFTARDSVEIIGHKPPKPIVPVFIYPENGQVLDYEGSYLFKVKRITSAEGYLWGFFQYGAMVWENYRDEGTLSSEEYGIHPGTPAHSRFITGPVEVWVRASINGQWTDAAVITIYLRSDGGPLDPTFGDGGRVITDFSSRDFGSAAALQSDGKILVAGTAFNGIDEDMALARYNTDGTLDMGFGYGGKVRTDFSGIFRVNINSASAQTLETLPGIGPTLAQSIIEYRDQNGLFWTIENLKNVPGVGPALFEQIRDLITVGNDSGQAVALLPDGRILVAGRSEDDFALVRYQSDGMLDASFGTSGRVITDLGGPYGIGLAIALQPDGKILVSGFGGTLINFATARYNSDGTLDTTFGTDGLVITHISGEDYGRTVAVQPDGKILVTGQTFVLHKGYNFVLVRYNSDGSLDTSFGIAGVVSTAFSSNSEDDISDALLQPDGKILAIGSTDGAEDRIFDFALARYNSDGSLDMTFGVGGKVTTRFGSGDAFGLAAALHPDGGILVAGQNLTPQSGFNFALARYNPDGSLDTNFGDNGTISSDIDGDDSASAVLIQPDGKIVLAGTSRFNFALARYLINGQAIEATIDIKPGSQTNHINPQSSGQVAVAVLSSLQFDALAMIDKDTVRFGHRGTEPSLLSCKERGRDVNGDGLRDLICVFSIPMTGLLKGDTVGILTAQTLDGTLLRGRDSVQVGQTGQDD